MRTPFPQIVSKRRAEKDVRAGYGSFYPTWCRSRSSNSRLRLTQRDRHVFCSQNCVSSEGGVPCLELSDSLLHKLPRLFVSQSALFASQSALFVSVANMFSTICFSFASLLALVCRFRISVSTLDWHNSTARNSSPAFVWRRRSGESLPSVENTRQENMPTC